MNTMPKEWLDFLREQYPEGSRVQLRSMSSDPRPLEPGCMGTLVHIDESGKFQVKWDDGRYLGVVIGEDSFSVFQPEPATLKLYMPMTAEIYERNEWGDLDDDSIPLDGRELLAHRGDILDALIKNRTPEESERGLMHWYNESDSVNIKVRSAVFTAEERNGQLWGVAECKVAGPLTPSELFALKEFITGQAADGWGEGFEQREIHVGDGTMYVHLWDSDRSWDVQTEEERFAPKVAEGLPEMCFSVLPDTGQLICIKRGESGYYPSDWSTRDKERNIQIADDGNESLGVTPAQRQAMEMGSMFGWDLPGADPKNYEAREKQEPPQMGGMTLA